MSKKAIDTSVEAFKSIDPTQLRDIHQKILKTLEVIGGATFEQIADHMCSDPAKIWRRMSEIERLKLVYRPGEKRELKSKRNAYVWYLTGKHMPKTEIENKKYTGPAVVDYARRINDISKQAKQLDLL